MVSHSHEDPKVAVQDYEDRNAPPKEPGPDNVGPSIEVMHEEVRCTAGEEPFRYKPTPHLEGW